MAALPSASVWPWDSEHALRCAGSLDFTAAAGEFPHVQLFNPGDSRVDILIEGLTLEANGVQRLALEKTRTPLATLSTNWRAAGAGLVLGTGQLRTFSGAALAGLRLGLLIMAALVEQQLRDLGWRLEPGTGLMLVGDSAATALRCGFLGREAPRP